MLAGGALAAGDDLGTLFDRVGDVGLDLLDRLHVDQRADHRTRLEVGDLQRACGVGKPLGEGNRRMPSCVNRSLRVGSSISARRTARSPDPLCKPWRRARARSQRGRRP